MSTVDHEVSIASCNGREGPEGAEASGIKVQFTRGCPLLYRMVGRALKLQELREYEYSSPGVVHCLMGW